MPKVTKPKSIEIGGQRLRVAVEPFGMRQRVVVVIGRHVDLPMNAEEARSLHTWLGDVAGWAKSLEPEFDERNE